MDWQGYEIGRRVVCVAEIIPHPSVTAALPGFLKPAKGEIVTVRAQHFGILEQTLLLKFSEYPDQHIDLAFGRRLNLFFRADDFRPLDESRLDQFRQYLHHVPADPDMVPA